MTITRIRILKRYLFESSNGVRIWEMLTFFFQSSYKTKALRVVNNIGGEGDLNKIYFKGYDDPLYFPKSFPLISLFQVVVESFYPKNWHYYEIPETRVNSNDVVVDCGAAEGLFSFLVKKKCKKVYVIEPSPVYLKALEKTFMKNANVEIIPVALADKEGKSRISINNISSALGADIEGEVITVTTIDHLFYKKNIPITYLKIDLEGYDLLALMGAKEIIRIYKPKIAVATYHNVEHANEISRYLKNLVPEYNILVKGIHHEHGSPIMLHAWI